MPAEPNQAKDLFLATAELAPAERAGYLDRACPGNAALRRRVEALLAAHDEPGSFPANQPAHLLATQNSRPGDAMEPGETRDNSGREEAVGSSLGPYKLLQKLGEGGMGSVYMAEQSQPVRRMVALKIIKAGLDTRQVVARFEAERQALALMDHPNIARVLDAGTTATGRPFFAMELVKGIPITRFCDEHHLTPRERLQLFIPVCQAVQHAHQKGIIHRDLKPSNVLVALYDDRPVPKVIDFGVAKATSQKLTDRTMFTEFGSVVGTLEYMSPEQAKLNALDVDTRSDIYALGVLLYELLTGTTPLERKRLKDSALDELLRLVREEEPPLPSTRLSQSKDSLPAVAAQRQTEPAKLAKLVRGDLDWIVMKALEKDRSRRYETASSLAHDVERYLSEQPVEACPPSTSYRLRKFLRRNKGPVVAAALLLLALVGGIAGTTWGLISASQALRSEARQRGIAEQAVDEKERARAATAQERDQKEQARAAAESALYFNRINLANQYWQSNNLIQSRRILDLCPNGVRGWEWRYLDHLHHADLANLAGNGQFTTELQLSKDGKRLAAFSAYGDAGVRIWDLAANKPLAEVSMLKANRRFTSVALSSDGRTIALGEESGAVGFWDADTGRLTREFAKLPRFVGSLSFSADGRWLAAAGADRRNGSMMLPWLEPPRNEDLVVWEVASGKEVFHPKGYGFVAQFSPDSSRLLSFKKNTSFRMAPMSPESFVALFDTTGWKEVAAGKLGPANSFAFSANGKRLALGGYDWGSHFVRLVDPADGNELTTLAPQVVGVNFDIALSPNGSTLAMTLGPGFSEIEIWDLKKRLRVRTLRGHTDWVNSIVFSPTGPLASCSRDNTIKFWDPAADQDVRQISSEPSTNGPATPAVLGPGGTFLAFGSGNTINLFSGPGRTITLVDLSATRINRPRAGGALSALTGVMSDFADSLLDTKMGSGDRELDGHRNGTLALGCSADGGRLISGGRSGDVKTWDLATGKELCTFRGHDGQIAAVALSPDGRWAASAHEPKEITQARSFPLKPIPVPVKVWDAATGRERFALTGRPDGVYHGISQLAFSPDGRLLASAGWGFVTIWDLATGTSLRELKQQDLQSGTADALMFSASGNLLAIAGDNKVQLCDATTGRSLALFQGHQGGKLAIAISPDQSRLATAAGRQVKLWDLRTGQEALTLPLPQFASGDRNTNVTAMAWSADGHRLRAALLDGSVIEWDASLNAAR